MITCDINPAEEAAALREKVGDLTGIEVFHNMVLVATYIRPEKTAGGIIRPQKNVDEDKWQGKAGLVLKTGPIAFVDDAQNQFHGVKLEPGDWALYSVQDGWQLTINGVHCRMLQDSVIKGRVQNPDVVF